MDRLSGEQKKWPAQSRAARTRIGLAHSLHPWTSRVGVSLAGVPPGGRCREVIDCCWWKLRCGRPGETDAAVAKDAWAHISQSISEQRLPFSQPLAPCLLSNSLLYSFELDTCISALAHMQIMGWPSSYCDDDSVLTEGELRDLSGNCFSVPLAAIVSSAMVMNRHASWWRQ